MKYLNALRGHFAQFPAFTIRDVKTFFSNTKLSPAYAHLMLHNLESKGELTRISKGNYTFKKDPLYAGFAFEPFYYGLQEALSLLGLWEQETNPVIITPRKVRSGVRQFSGNNFVLKRISRKMFFGFQPVRYYDAWLPVSTPEKTLVDFVYFRQKLPDEVLKQILEKIDENKLEATLQKAPLTTANRTRKMLRRISTNTTFLNQ